MKLLLIIALLLCGCQGFHLVRRAPPIEIAPKIAPTVVVDAPSLWTPTPEPTP